MTWYKKTGYTNSKTTRGLDGNYYASMFECSYANELFAKEKNGEIETYDKQVRLPLIVNGYKIADYIADFIVTHKDGEKELVETKGFITPVFSLKWKLVEACYGEEYKITMVKQGKGSVRKIKKVIEY